MEKYSHNCIKCKLKYEDTDPDPYYCASCNEERKRIAKEIDEKLAGRIKKPVVSGLQQYDEAMKKRKGFPHIGDLGIKL